MKARLEEAWLEVLGDQFWLRPAAMVFLCVAAAQGAVWIEVLRLVRWSKVFDPAVVLFRRR